MTRKPAPPSKILSDVVMHSQPHSLVRPKRDVKTAAPKAISQVDEQAQIASDAAPILTRTANTPPELSLEELRAKAYHDAYSKGMQEGHAIGKQTGFDAGLKEGRESGLRLGQNDLTVAQQQQAERFNQMMQAISDEIVHRLYMIEEEMVALVHETICRIVGHAISSEEGVRQIIGQAISELRNRPLISIRLSPDDFAWMQNDQQFFAVLSQVDRGAGVQILPDDRVKLGGCIIDSPEGSIDARLETQLQKISESLLLVYRTRAERIKSGMTS